MKKVFFLLTILILISCKKEQEKSSSDLTPMVSKSSTEKIRERDFPLKDLSKVEFLSYEDRMRWDDIKNRYTKDLVVDYKLNFDSTQVKERVVLNSVLKTELLELMSQDSCKLENLPRDCYMPRHMIIFRDQKNRIIGYKELCLSCHGFRESKNLENYNGFCYSQMEELFKKAGIKYFDEDYE
ncbi:hypothetical protein [Flavobacterium sp. KACC 22761]|uniref:hypothetical protein n=1 Tax=Flavobacterium sp. KACC 22761 TaxID=3092665 RepID=UPI002A74BF27|nr:hypothetical protein [Flavobacterium sp. KACC 22761]WPO77403.1 hypothetical protein SCB73_14130 [Flavobacterium sp. KACC 22761]